MSEGGTRRHRRPSPPQWSRQRRASPGVRRSSTRYRLDFAELATEARRVAGALVASGIEPGERIAIWAPNIAEWVLAALGAYHCGAVVVTMNTRFKGAKRATSCGRRGRASRSPWPVSSTPTSSRSWPTPDRSPPHRVVLLRAAHQAQPTGRSSSGERSRSTTASSRRVSPRSARTT